VFRKCYVWRFRIIHFKERYCFSVRTHCDNIIIVGRSVCCRWQRWLNMKYWYGNERRLRDDLRCRTLEITSYCHPTATFDIVLTLFSVSSRIKDWSAANWNGCHMKNLSTERYNIYSHPSNKIKCKIPILSLIFFACPKAQGSATTILTFKSRASYI
jgi:hypothetical protein